jgi:hypothetical protein
MLKYQSSNVVLVGPGEADTLPPGMEDFVRNRISDRLPALDLRNALTTRQLIGRKWFNAHSPDQKQDLERAVTFLCNTCQVPLVTDGWDDNHRRRYRANLI